ncbi:LOW QUALITY PROTEIN: hypothetical protein V2J09_021315 [Rumex salicifolius]
MTYIGLMSHCHRIEAKRKGIFISEERYAKKILKKLKMENFKKISTLTVSNAKLSKYENGGNVDPTLFKSLGV